MESVTHVTRPDSQLMPKTTRVFRNHLSPHSQLSLTLEDREKHIKLMMSEQVRTAVLPS
jgi:hypothetical protein